MRNVDEFPSRAVVELFFDTVQTRAEHPISAACHKTSTISRLRGIRPNKNLGTMTWRISIARGCTSLTILSNNVPQNSPRHLRMTSWVSLDIFQETGKDNECFTSLGYHSLI